MLLSKEKIQHVNSITHEGKVVVVATDAEGRMWYTIKQDGFEDSYLKEAAEQRTGWEDWKSLGLPLEEEDQSVVAKEKAELTYRENNTDISLLKSLYTTQDLSAVAPVQLVSGLGHLYVFRQSKSNTLLVDRFVLDGLTNQLTRKLEVRFKRSKQKHKPSENQRRGSDGNLSNIDSLDFTDINGNSFYEPTTELSLINNLANGWFSVVLLPTSEQDKYRWHIFAYSSATQKVELTTLRASEEGLFEVKDYTILDPEPRSIPGIIKRTLNLGNLAVAKGLTATRYDVQKERTTEEEDEKGAKIKQLLRESVRVMLAVGTSAGNVAAISFAVAADGTLSQIKDIPDSTKIRRNTPRQVLLPLNTLDEIKAIGTTNSPLQGRITGFARGKNDEVILTSNQATELDKAEITQVKITGGKDCNCLYSSVTVIDGNTFEITSDSDLCGNWEIIPEEETGLIYNGIVTTYQITQEGKLKVTALNHGLRSGEAVQVVNTKDYNGTYAVTRIDDKSFSLDGVRWQAGTAINARLQTEKRRGITFDEASAKIEVPNSLLNDLATFTMEGWVKAFSLPNTTVSLFGQSGVVQLGIHNKKLKVSTSRGGEILADSPLPENYSARWYHIAVVGNGTNLTLYLDGQVVKIGGSPIQAPAIESGSSGPSISTYGTSTQPFKIGADVWSRNSTIPSLDGQISDVRIWKTARTTDEIDKYKYLQLTGREVGLVGYWRLDAIFESENERKVINFTVNGYDGVVYGGGYVSAITLQRNLPGTSAAAIKYENEELVAVSERATYTEEFEFTIDGNVDPNHADNSGGKVFALTYKGKKNRNAQDWISITSEITSIEGGWYEYDLDLVSIAATKILPVQGKQLIAIARDDQDALRFRVFDHQEKKVVDWVEVDIAPDKRTKLEELKNLLKPYSSTSQIPPEDKKRFIEAVTSITGHTHWYKARSRFTVPDGVSMVRSFGIANIRGSWNTLGIRKHQIQLISNSITEQVYVDDIALITLSNNQLQLQKDLEQLDAKERQEGLLIEEKRKLEAKIAVFNLTGAQKQLATTAKNNEIAAQNASIATLKVELSQLQSTYQAEKDNLLNYWCKLVNWTDRTETSAARIESNLLVYNNNPAYVDFKFVETDPGYYRIIWTCDGELELYGSPPPDRRVYGVSSPSGHGYQWRIESIGGSAYYGIVNRATGDALERGSRHNSNNVYVWPGAPADSEFRAWKIVRTSGETNNNISKALSNLNDKKTQLATAEEQLRQLNKQLDELTLSDSTAQKEQSETRLKIVISQLAKLQTDLNILNISLVKSITTSKQTRQDMKLLHEDKRKLETRGALLGFVRPASRLNAIETCEGNVQLSYFDDQGRMRQTNFDATYENGRGEQWIPDSLRTCLNFNRSSSVVTLNTSIPLGEDWTIEAWFSYPLPETQSEWHTLVEGKNGDAHVRVKNGKQLGTWIGQKFNDSGFSMESLSRGWHHLTVSRRSNNTLSYYIDGTQVGTEERVIQFDGVDDHISCPSLNSNFSQGITVEAWVWYDAFQTNSRVIDFGGGQSDNIIFCNQGTSNTLIFSVLKGTVTQCITAPNALQIGEWMHLAATIDASGNAKLYKNGSQIATGPVSIPNSLNRTSNNIGKSNWKQDSYFKGKLSEVRIWNKCRPEAEIKATIGQRLSDAPSNLIACYPLNEIQLEGTTQKVLDCVANNHGTVTGATINPTKTLSFRNFISSGIKDVCTIGNSAKRVNGVNAAAMQFDGVDDYIELSPSRIPTGSEITVSFWAKDGSSLSKRNSILEAKNAAGRIFTIHLPWSDGKVYFYCGFDSTWYDVIEKAAPTQDYKGRWIHWAFTKNAVTGDMKIYLNGELWHSATGKTRSLSAATQCYLGKADADQCYEGSIAEVHIWDKARTQVEIQAEMNQQLSATEPNLVAYYTFAERFGKVAEVRIWGIGLSAEEIAINSKTLLTGNEPGLLAYYPFDEDTGTTVEDRRGESSDGTIVGASWWGCAAPIGDLGHPGVKPQVMQFNGTNAYIDLGEEIRVSSKFTQEVWIYSTITDDNYHGFLGNPGTGSNNRAPSIWVYQRRICASFSATTNTFTLLTDEEVLTLDQWSHVAVTFDGKDCTIYVNGELKKKDTFSVTQLTNTPIKYIGKVDNWFQGKVSEVRIWNTCRTQSEIQANMSQRLTGKEAGLVGYWQLDHIIAEGSTSKVLDVTNNRPGTVNQAILVSDQNIPIISDAVVCSEYSTISQDRTAMMRRFFAAPATQGVQLLPDKRVEELELRWIGNGQFAPTLLGYIEGPPPIPSENLTLEQNYNGATSVELALSEDVQFKWTRSQESAWGSSIENFLGLDRETTVGLGVATKEHKFRAGGKSKQESSLKSQNESSITSSSSLTMTDKLRLVGTQEQNGSFPHLGKRFIPKNVGYALVVSAMADVFVTRLQRTRKMIGYQVLPVENIPPDINTITFLINPAYTMSGSLDGMTGSSATSKRFFKHVPEMRSQFGSLYPASYYRLQEAYHLKRKIEEQDKARESYFSQFDSQIFAKYRLGVSDEKYVDAQISKGNEPREVSFKRSEDQPSVSSTGSPTNEQTPVPPVPPVPSEDNQSAAVKAKQTEIASLIKDPNRRANATASFAGWQKKMEDIQIRASKRNIANTYVWDADGGLRCESQSFANTAEHSIGGSFSLNTAFGGDFKFGLFGLTTELTVLATFNLTQTMSKTETRSKGIQLNVDLSGVESRGVTDYNDSPILPGEKVGRYRFMSFYLEGSTNHFNDFFNYVVDPEWLASNSEEARALRQAKGKANKTWRVLHRVTYVERPALMGFGRDMRQLPPANSVNDLGQLQAKVNNLEQQNAEIQRKLDAILKKLLP